MDPVRTQGGDCRLHGQERPREGLALPRLDGGRQASRMHGHVPMCKAPIGRVHGRPRCLMAPAVWECWDSDPGRLVQAEERVSLQS